MTVTAKIRRWRLGGTDEMRSLVIETPVSTFEILREGNSRLIMGWPEPGVDPIRTPVDGDSFWEPRARISLREFIERIHAHGLARHYAGVTE